MFKFHYLFYAHIFYCFQIDNFILIQYECTGFLRLLVSVVPLVTKLTILKVMTLCTVSICNNTNAAKSPRRVDKSPDPGLSGGLSNLLKPFPQVLIGVMRLLV